MNKVKIFVAAVCMVAMSFVSNAQTATGLKIGYTNSEYILALMPESKRIESDLKAYSTQLENQLKSMYADYQAKAESYKSGASTMTEIVRTAREKELMNKEKEIQEFQKDAEANLQKKQQSLLEPAYKKMQKAIDDVAKENGYTYIFNTDAGYGANILLHAPEDGNVSDLILKKMGVTPPAKGAANTPAATTSPSVNNAPTKPAVTPIAPAKKKK